MTLWDEAKELAQDVVMDTIDVVDADGVRTPAEQRLVERAQAVAAYVIAATEYAYAGSRLGRGGRLDKHVMARLNEADALVASVQPAVKRSHLRLVTDEAA